MHHAAPTVRPAPWLVALLLAVACGGTGPSDDGVARVLIGGDAALTLVEGDTHQLSATAQDANGAAVVGAPLVWSSSTQAVATVSTGGLVTAVATGSARIIATSGRHADTVVVTVAKSGVVNVVVTIPRSLLKVSDTVRAQATAVDAAGKPVPDRPVTWTSSNGTAAVVTPFGLVLGVAPANPVTISATVDGHSGSTTIAIIPADIASVKVSPDTAILAPGGSVRFQVVATDEFGFVVAQPQVTWASFITSVATVDDSGTVSALTVGESTVSATVRGTLGQALVRVLNVDTEKYRIEVTNYLAYPVEVLENGNSVGLVGGQSTGVIERPLRQSAILGWALVRPQHPEVGEPIFETRPAITNPTGTIHIDADNVMDDGRVYYTPFIRNLTGDKPLFDPLPKLEATPCICSLSVSDPETRDLGYWLLNATSVARFFGPADNALSNPRATVGINPAGVEARSGIYRYNLTALP